VINLCLQRPLRPYGSLIIQRNMHACSPLASRVW